MLGIILGVWDISEYSKVFDFMEFILVREIFSKLIINVLIC